MGPATWHDEGKLLHLGLGFPLLPFLVAKRGLSGLLTPELSEIFSQLVIRGEEEIVKGRWWWWEDALGPAGAGRTPCFCCSHCG